MSSNQHPVTRAVYLAVLTKDLPSPLAPESDEEKDDAKDKAPGKKPDDDPKIASTDKAADADTKADAKAEPCNSYSSAADARQCNAAVPEQISVQLLGSHHRPRNPQAKLMDDGTCYYLYVVHCMKYTNGVRVCRIPLCNARC